MDCSMIRLDSVTKRFGTVTAVDQASLCVARGEVVAVLGPSGCGKTTLLRLIAGFERPDGGTVTIGESTVAGRGFEVPPERRPRDERAAFTQRTLELVGLQHKAGRYPHELSGGERQRVALARALAPEPEVVLLDEPFSSLDATLRADLRREVELILRDAEATALLVTHDQEEALSLADRVAVMRDGRIVQVGPPVEVYGKPATR